MLILAGAEIFRMCFQFLLAIGNSTLLLQTVPQFVIMCYLTVEVKANNKLKPRFVRKKITA